jgi:hypothetical protein
MNELDILKWIKKNLSPCIQEALKANNPDNFFTEEWLAAIACRETACLIHKDLDKNLTFSDMCLNMKGDFTNGLYHGFSFWQIDIRSFPDFINSGDWKYPVKACKKAIEVLYNKARYLSNQFNPDEEERFKRAVTASYNVGEKTVKKSIIQKEDVDTHTTGHNYSSEVFRMMEIYKGLA